MTIRISFSDKTVMVVVEINGAIESAITELPKREWVGLTDQELVALRERVQEYTPIDSIKYGEAIQRAMTEALKEKNA
jgi:hypothetical protein